MATTTVALAVVAVSNARRHAALTDEFESANAGSWNVERINGLIYAMVMDSRGIYMSADTPRREICRRAAQGQRSDQRSDRRLAAQRPQQRALAFSNFAVRLNGYQDFRYELAPIAKQSGAAGRSRMGRQKSAGRNSQCAQ